MTDEKQLSLPQAIEKYATGLAAQIGKFVDDISELEVRTYSTPQEQMKVRLQGKEDIANIETHGDVQLRAYTRISFEGDTTIFVPEKDGVIDTSVWNIHQNMVNTAIENRQRLLRVMGESAASALSALRKVNE